MMYNYNFKLRPSFTRFLGCVVFSTLLQATNKIIYKIDKNYK